MANGDPIAIFTLLRARVALRQLKSAVPLSASDLLLAPISMHGFMRPGGRDRGGSARFSSVFGWKILSVANYLKGLFSY